MGRAAAGSRLTAEAVDIAARLIRCDSRNPGADERRCAELVSDLLAEAGIAHEVVESRPGRCSVVARHRGSGSPEGALLVQGHLDVVAPQDEGWTHDPFGGVIADDCLWGRGAVDMKGAVAMALACQRELARSGAVPRRDLVFAYFADEEMGGGLGVRWILEHRPDLLAGVSEAIGEVGGFSVEVSGGRRLYPVQVGERGAVWVRARATATGGHAAFSEEVSPIVPIARYVGELQTLAFERGEDPVGAELRSAVGDEQGGALLMRFLRFAERAATTTAAPTVMRAGTKTNVIPDAAALELDCRIPPGTADAVVARLEETLPAGMTLEVTMRVPGYTTAGYAPMLAACRTALRAVDPAAVVAPYVLPATTDASHLTAAGIRCFGFMPLPLPAGFDYLAMFHGVDERVPLRSLADGARALLRFLRDC